jgi:hypothetical protein
MAAEQPARRRFVMAAHWFAVAYVLASIVAALIGWPLIKTLHGDALQFMIGYCLLGPLSRLVHALYGHGDALVGLTYYAVQTVLLAGSLLLWTLKFRPARWLGYASTAVLWLGSGYMMALTWYFSA